MYVYVVHVHCLRALVCSMCVMFLATHVHVSVHQATPHILSTSKSSQLHVHISIDVPTMQQWLQFG